MTNTNLTEPNNKTSDKNSSTNYSNLNIMITPENSSYENSGQSSHFGYEIPSLITPLGLCQSQNNYPDNNNGQNLDQYSYGLLNANPQNFQSYHHLSPPQATTAFLFSPTSMEHQPNISYSNHNNINNNNNNNIPLLSQVPSFQLSPSLPNMTNSSNFVNDSISLMTLTGCNGNQQ